MSRGFSHLSDCLVRQIEQRHAQAVQIVPVGIDKKIDALGGAHESGLNHGHAAHDDIADRFPVEATAEGEEIG